jgi:hypothetical protein
MVNLPHFLRLLSGEVQSTRRRYAVYSCTSARTHSLSQCELPLVLISVSNAKFQGGSAAARDWDSSDALLLLLIVNANAMVRSKSEGGSFRFALLQAEMTVRQ